MRENVFRGGIRPQDSKAYIGDYVHLLYEPAGDLVIPLTAGFGAKAKALVSVGDEVMVGQRLSECPQLPSLGAHSPCSGRIKAIERRETASGITECIVLENDRRFDLIDGVGAKIDWLELSRSDILSRIIEAGASGILPKRFPTAAKLDQLKPDSVSRIVVDGSGWEPVVTSDTDILRTRAYEVADGLKILLRLFPGAAGVILIGKDKEDTLDSVRDALRGAEGIKIKVVPAGQPTGSEEMIQSALSSIVPGSCKDICLVETAAEAAAISDAVSRSTPFFRRIVTVAGSAVKNPGNFLVRIGTSCAELLAAAGGLRPGIKAENAVLGGPLTGTALSTLDVPVLKDTTALLLFAEDEREKTEGECIRCGRCADICPAGLLPMELLKAARSGEIDKFEKLHGLDCISCGMCSWACPSRQPLAEYLDCALAMLRK